MTLRGFPAVGGGHWRTSRQWHPALLSTILGAAVTKYANLDHAEDQ